jgi:hypothetical protein
MPSSVKYIVRRGFKYLGRNYKAGDEFIPCGQRNDDLIIEQFCWTDRVKKNIKRGEKAEMEEVKNA